MDKLLGIDVPAWITVAEASGHNVAAFTTMLPAIEAGILNASEEKSNG